MPMAIPSIAPDALASSDMPSSQEPKPALMSGAPVRLASTNGSGSISSSGSPASARRLGARRRTRAFSALCQKAVDGQWSRAPQDEGRKAGEVKEIGFKARRPELGAGSRHSLKLDRTEPIGKMHGKDGNQENRRHRYAGERHQRTEKHGQAAKYLNQDREPPHEMRCRHANRVQNYGERIRAPGQLGEAMLHEAVPDDQTQRDRSPTGEPRSADQIDGEVAPHRRPSPDPAYRVHTINLAFVGGHRTTL